MKRIIPSLLFFISLSAFADWSSPDTRNALRDGAEAKYVYRVVDDEGTPVSYAIAHVWFSSYGRPQDNANWKLKTDTNGMFSVTHRFNERFSVGIEKDGYYRTSDEIFYLGLKDLPVKDGKWQPYGVLKTVVLKRIRRFGGLMIFSDSIKWTKIPVFDKWLGFDFEKCDWVPPFGRGTESDVLIKFGSVIRKKYADFHYSMSVSFTNTPYAGAYILPCERSSQLVTTYEANTNMVFKREFFFEQRFVRDGERISNWLDDRSYLVFRTRTRTDENGKLVSAHYGKILGSWCSSDKYMSISDGCFNPVPNDVNIEDGATLRNSFKELRR